MAASSLSALSDQRPKDKFGIAAAYARVSPWARALDLEFPQQAGPAWPVRSYEQLLTAVYQYEVRGGCSFGGGAWLSSWETAVTTCAGANGLFKSTLFGTP